MSAAEIALFGFGYPASVGVLTRFVAVVRERRWRWLMVHHLGVAAIVAGYASRRTMAGIVTNGAWLVASSLWYALGGRDDGGQPSASPGAA